MDALEQHGSEPAGRPDDFKARCPHPDHEDSNASLHIWASGRGASVHCHSRQCDRSQIIGAIGVTWPEMFLDFDPEYARALAGRNGSGTKGKGGNGKQPPKCREQPDRLPPDRMLLSAFLAKLPAAGINYRTTPNPAFVVVAECPACAAPDLWVHDANCGSVWAWEDGEGSLPLRFSCPRGCAREHIYNGLARRAHEQAAAEHARVEDFHRVP